MYVSFCKRYINQHVAGSSSIYDTTSELKISLLNFFLETKRNHNWAQIPLGDDVFTWNIA